MTPNPSLISGVLVAAITGYVGHQTIYRDAQRTMTTLRAQLTDQQQTQGVREQAAKSLQEIERLRQRLPQTLETEWLVREVSRLAEEADLRLATILPISPKQVVGLEGVMTLSVALEFTASYHQLGKLLSMVESAPAFIRVDELILARTGEGLAKVQLTVSTLHVPAGAPPIPGLRKG